MDAATLTGIITGPAAALALAILATWKLWARVEKLVDQLQVLVADNTKAMLAMQASSEKVAHSLEQLSGEVRLLNGALRPEVSRPDIRPVP